jgi:hypothetical protein
MKNKVGILILSTVLSCSNLFAQDQDVYMAKVEKAWSLYNQEEYLKSAMMYSEAFIALNNKGTIDDRYNAACSWALANQPDSSFVQLLKIGKSGKFINLGHITTDTDLASLHTDIRWDEVVSLVKENKQKAEANLDQHLVSLLDSIYTEDQLYRSKSRDVREQYGRDSEEMRSLWDTIQEKDALNLILVKKILDEQGWLGTDVVGYQGNSTLFLVIQHSNLETQEQYLPMMREAVEKGNAQGSSLALLEDRVALRKGELQIYGSQIGIDQDGGYYISPMIDPDNVNDRRATVGLGTIEVYIQNWDMTWDVEAYKKKMPEYIERENR